MLLLSNITPSAHPNNPKGTPPGAIQKGGAQAWVKESSNAAHVTLKKIWTVGGSLLCLEMVKAGTPDVSAQVALATKHQKCNFMMRTPMSLRSRGIAGGAFNPPMVHTRNRPTEAQTLQGGYLPASA